MKRMLCLAVLQLLSVPMLASATTDNPFMPPPSTDEAEIIPSELALPDKEVRERVARGELRFMGQVNEKKVYYDTILNQFEYQIDLSPAAYQD